MNITVNMCASCVFTLARNESIYIYIIMYTRIADTPLSPPPHHPKNRYTQKHYIERSDLMINTHTQNVCNTHLRDRERDRKQEYIILYMKPQNPNTSTQVKNTSQKRTLYILQYIYIPYTRIHDN